MNGYVYIIGDGTTFKIGITLGTPEKRLKQIQTACPLRLTMAMAFQCENTVDIEKELHDRFAEKHVYGEWFSLDSEDIDILQKEYRAKGFVFDEGNGNALAKWSCDAPNLLNSYRKIIEHECVVCGGKFQGIVQAKYCSNRCRQAAKYQRNKIKKD